MIYMAMFGSGVRIGMIKTKIQKSCVAVRGTMLLSALAPPSVSGSILLIVVVLWGFVSSELYLRFLRFFTYCLTSLIVVINGFIKSIF